MDQNDSMCKFMKEKGFPNDPDVTKPDHTTVFSFPVKSSEDAILRDDYTAIEMMELCLLYQQNWCEHKASITVNVRENEWVKATKRFLRRTNTLKNFLKKEKKSSRNISRPQSFRKRN